MKLSSIGASLFFTAVAALAPSSAWATAVTCGSTNTAYLRVVTVDPALVGGLCYTQLGNFTPAEGVAIVGSGAVHLDKDERVDTVIHHETWLTGFSTTNGGLFGNWTVDMAAWNAYDQLFLGFHFGGGGDTNASNPDVFIVELARTDLTGTWSLGGGDGAKLNGLSHIDLIGLGDRITGVGGTVPEPASLALALLALGAAGFAGRRRSSPR